VREYALVAVVMQNFETVVKNREKDGRISSLCQVLPCLPLRRAAKRAKVSGYSKISAGWDT
jgi:hypothetical protein